MPKTRDYEDHQKLHWRERDKKKDPYANPKDLQGMKKPPLHLVPPISTLWEAMAMGDGGIKYGPYNWRDKKVVATIYVAAAKRHLDLWLERETYAEDSGVHHLGHAKACCGILLDAEANECLIDDRPTRNEGYQKALDDALRVIAEWDDAGRFEPKKEK